MAVQERLRDAFRGVEAMGVLLWGSHARGEATPRSDVDVCLVAGPGRDPGEVLRAAWRGVRPDGLRIDVKVFEDLPVYLQGEVLRDHVVVRCGDEADLYGHLRPFWKRWHDQAHRQRLTGDEARAMLAAAAGV